MEEREPDEGDEQRTRALLEAWCAGDRGALATLLAEELPWLQRRVTARLGDALRDRVDSLDMVQELAMDALEYAPRFVVSSRAQFRALLARMVENNLRDARRFHERRGLGDRAGSVHESVLDLDGGGGARAAPQQAAAKSDLREWLELALEFLPEEDRRLVRGREFEGKGFEALGEELGMKANTARMRFQRALAKLSGHIRDLRRGSIDSLFAE